MLLVSVFPVGSLSANTAPWKLSFHDFFRQQAKTRIVSHLWQAGVLIVTVPVNFDSDTDTIVNARSAEDTDTFWESSVTGSAIQTESSSCPDLEIPETVQVRYMLERIGRHVTSVLAESLIEDKDRVGMARNLLSINTDTKSNPVLPAGGFKFCNVVRALPKRHSPSWELEEVEEVSTLPTFQLPFGWHVRVAVTNSNSNSFELRQVIVLFDSSEQGSKSSLSFPIDSHDSSTLVYGRSYRFTSLPDTAVMLESATDANVASEDQGHAEDSPEELFCMDMGMPMVMFLRGFRSSLYSKEMLPCLSYYVRSWVLDEEGKFKGAMVYSFLLGLLTQGLSVLRVLVLLYVKKRELRKCLRVAIYVCQVFMGYILMLVAMAYSVELLLSAVVGVAFGYFLFHKGQPQSKHSSGPREPLLTGNGSTAA
jgi:hypothetical protein